MADCVEKGTINTGETEQMGVRVERSDRKAERSGSKAEESNVKAEENGAKAEGNGSKVEESNVKAEGNGRIIAGGDIAANIIEITDFSAPELDIYARLPETQLLHFYEPERGLFIAESPKVIERALQAGYQPVSLLMETKHIAGQGREIIRRCGNIPVYTASLEVLTRLTGFPMTRGMLCAMYRAALPTMEQVCEGARRIVVLENVMNPTNVGAIFRSAAALQMDGILLTSGCSDPLYRRAVRVSMGTVFQIPWTFLAASEWPRSGMERLRHMGFRTAAMALCNQAVSIEEPRLQAAEKLAIVLGTEGDGLARDTIANCDDTVMIPMSNGVDSLNVAAASAVAFWQLGRRSG